MTHNIIKNYISYLLSLIYKLKKELQTCINYKIVNIKEMDHSVILSIQVVGQQKLLSCSPEEIVAHDGFLEGFSKQDVRTLTYFATRTMHAPSVSVLEQRINYENDKKIFQIYDKKENLMINNTAMEISKKRNLIKKMDPLDAHLLGYAAHAESYELERIQLNFQCSKEN